MKYFTLNELTYSSTAKQKGINNTPNTTIKANLINLVDNILDPLREAYGKPIVVTSGYRCLELNKAVKGAPKSQHVKGEAADIRTQSDKPEDNKKLFDLALKLNLPFDQLIDEYKFTTEKTCNVSGDPYALYAEISSYFFYKLFSDSKIVDAGGINLDGYIMSAGCYSNMFLNCSNLTVAPKLPAVVLTEQCYNGMFIGCASLTTAPELPATNLANDCYNGMFSNCTSLTTAPELPATTLQANCYRYMFNGCTSLNYIKALFTTAPSSSYTESWVSGVSSTGKFVKNRAATWVLTGNNGIPEGWTVQIISV